MKRLGRASHVDAVLKLCSPRIFLLKQLRDQGLSRGHLHSIVLTLTIQYFSSHGIKPDRLSGGCFAHGPAQLPVPSVAAFELSLGRS